MVNDSGHPIRLIRYLRLYMSVLIVVGLLTACAPAPPAAPTSAPAKPAEAAKPAEVAKPAEAAKPADAAKPAAPAATTAPAAATQAKPAEAAKPAGAAPKGQLVMVVESEPDTIVTKNASTNIAYLVLDNVYDHLTFRDWSSGEPKIVAELAESWTRPDPNTWRFKLRPGVTFHNGEPFTADAVVAAVEDIVNPAEPGTSLGEYGFLKSAAKIDELTVDINTSQPDAILPARMTRFPIPAPGWLKSVDPQNRTVTAVGSGPYTLVEWQKGSHLLLRANEKYWGAKKATINEVKILGRKEAAVRAGMAQTGEATLAYLIPAEQRQQMPQSIIEPTMESPSVRLNPQHPVLKDIRVRQAIVYAIDTKGIIDALYPGGVAVPLKGQLIRKGSVGWNANLQDYPYQPDVAKKLIQEAGASGTKLEIVTRPNYFPKASEVTEIIANSLGQIGLEVSIRAMEIAQWNEALRAVKPDQQQTDLLLRSPSNPVLDSSRVVDQSYMCGARFSLICDPKLDQMLKEAGGQTGEERDKTYQAAWAYAYDQYWFIPLFGLDYVHGASPKLKWTPHADGITLFTEMTLAD
jgi:peptide/nickel transport system substrate-binding protein